MSEEDLKAERPRLKARQSRAVRLEGEREGVYGLGRRPHKGLDAGAATRHCGVRDGSDESRAPAEVA